MYALYIKNMKKYLLFVCLKYEINANSFQSEDLLFKKIRKHEFIDENKLVVTLTNEQFYQRRNIHLHADRLNLISKTRYIQKKSNKIYCSECKIRFKITNKNSAITWCYDCQDSHLIVTCNKCKCNNYENVEYVGIKQIWKPTPSMIFFSRKYPIPQHAFKNYYETWKKSKK